MGAVLRAAAMAAAALASALPEPPAIADDDPAPTRFQGAADDPLLPRCAAPPEAIDPRALEALVRESDAQRSDALLVVVNGCRVVDRRAAGAPELFDVMSVTKSVVSLAVGLLVEEGRISGLDAPVSTWLPEWKRGAKARVTLRHLLTHTSGLRHEPTTRALDEQRDRLAWARALPVIEAQVGTISYNNEAVQLLSGIVSRAAGRPVDRYLAERARGSTSRSAPRWRRRSSRASLPAAATTGAPETPPAAHDPHQALDAEVERGVRAGDGGCDVERAHLARVIADPPYLLTSARVDVVARGEGPGGLPLLSVRRRSIFDRVGLRRGDLVRAVNDKPVVSHEELATAFAGWQKVDSWRVTVDRGRSTVTITCAVK